MDNKKVLDKVEGRRHAKEIFDLIEINEEAVDFREAFWLKFISLIPIPPDAPIPILKQPTMTEGEARRFERVVIRFGMNQGLTYGDCDTDYLIFLHTQGQEISSYLRSKIGQDRQETPLRSTLEKEDQDASSHRH